MSDRRRSTSSIKKLLATTNARTVSRRSPSQAEIAMSTAGSSFSAFGAASMPGLQTAKARRRTKQEHGQGVVYRKGELTPVGVDRGWPHQVALRSDVAVRDFHMIHAFCKD